MENLSLNDLKNILIIIDYAADNGAFKGWENIRKVMELRDKLEKFINSVDEKIKDSEKNHQSLRKNSNEKKIKDVKNK